MQIDKLSDSWLFQKHAKQTVAAWLLQLRYFYFIRAVGGHANDGDEFLAAFIFSDKRDLIEKIEQLGIAIYSIPDNYPRPVPGQSYTGEEYEKFKTSISQFPDLEQPGHSIVFGHNVFIWVHNNAINIRIANRYEVSEEDFITCLSLEKHFDELGWQNIIDRSPEQMVCCISRSRYPELFMNNEGM